jgi:MYXO-CTERM domain-containing protein
MSANVQGTGTTLNSEFPVISAPSGSALPLTASVSYTIAMAPESVGAKDASFVITLDGGTTISVSLMGNAVDAGSGSGGDKNRETFYACSTSGGAGGWLIVVALGVCVFAWRRRRG